MLADRDPLWTGGAHDDPELARLERLLRTYRHVPAAPSRPGASAWGAKRRSTWRRTASLAMLVATLSLALVVGGWFAWRLQWGEGTGWQMTVAASGKGRLAVGDSVVTGRGERAELAVARIGTVALSPQSRLSLLETGSGQHRVALESGHLHARIWAPPGWFRVRVPGAEVLDLGCEFDLWTDAAGNGRTLVASGWVLHSRGGEDTLVPAGHELSFDAARAGVPLRTTADPAFRAAAGALDLLLSRGGRDPQAEAELALRAGQADRFTLLSLMTRHPALANGPIYPRLARMLDVSQADARHRLAWSQGSAHAINDWWDRVPRPPKQWWRYWRDALY